MDQHNKWLRFGLHWHGCVNGFTGKILWLTVWWNNLNPKFVCAQYLGAVRKVGGTCGISLLLLHYYGTCGPYTGAPCVTQSDLGTENFNVAYAHTHIRHALNPTLAGSIQHQWKRGHTNIRPEQMWSWFCKMWVPGFEKLLQTGIQKHWYDMVNIGDRCVGLLSAFCMLIKSTYWMDSK